MATKGDVFAAAAVALLGGAALGSSGTEKLRAALAQSDAQLAHALAQLSGTQELVRRREMKIQDLGRDVLRQDIQIQALHDERATRQAQADQKEADLRDRLAKALAVVAQQLGAESRCRAAWAVSSALSAFAQRTPG